MFISVHWVYIDVCALFDDGFGSQNILFLYTFSTKRIYTQNAIYWPHAKTFGPFISPLCCAVLCCTAFVHSRPVLSALLRTGGGGGAAPAPPLPATHYSPLFPLQPPLELCVPPHLLRYDFATRLRFQRIGFEPVTGTGPDPECALQTLTPTRLLCRLHVSPETRGIWNVTLAAFHDDHEDEPVHSVRPVWLELRRPPVPVVVAAACGVRGCVHGARLTVKGQYFVPGRTHVALLGERAGATAPACGAAEVRRYEAVCVLNVPNATSGYFVPVVAVGDQPSGAGPPVFLHPALPRVLDVRCSSGPTTLGPGACAPGAVLNATIAHLGPASTAAPRVRFTNGSGPAPQCAWVARTPAGLQCAVTFPGRVTGVWALVVAVGGVEGPPHPVTFVPPPAPDVQRITGCAPGGCVQGDALTVHGRNVGPTAEVRLSGVGGPTCRVTATGDTTVACVLDAALWAPGYPSLEVVSDAGQSRSIWLQFAPVPLAVTAVGGCPGAVCGATLAFGGTGFGAGVAVRLRPTRPRGGSGAAPGAVPDAVCHVLRAGPGAVECWLAVPDPAMEAWLWQPALAAGATELPAGGEVRVTRSPAPAGVALGGCAAQGCQDGDVLALTGRHLQPLLPHLHAVAFRARTNATANAPGNSTATGSGSPSGSGNASSNATGNTTGGNTTATVTADSPGAPVPTCAPVITDAAGRLTCLLRVPPTVAGAWHTTVSVAGLAAPAAVPLALAPAEHLPVVHSVLCPALYPGHAPQCVSATVVTLLGRRFRTADDSPTPLLTFSGGAAAAARPSCRVLSTTDSELRCLLSVPEGAGSRWALQIANPLRSAGLAVALQPLRPARLAAVTGCGPAGCRTGDRLTIAGRWFEPGRPAAHNVTLAPLATANTTSAGPVCRVVNSSCQTVECDLVVPEDCPGGAWDLRLTVNGTLSENSLPLRLQALAPVVTSLSCAGVAHPGGACPVLPPTSGPPTPDPAAYGCAALRTLVVHGARFGVDPADVRVAFAAPPGAAPGPAPPTCGVTTASDGVLECVLALPQLAAAGPWEVTVLVQGQPSAPTPLTVLAPPPPEVTAVSGCPGAPGGCASGDAVTVHGTEFLPEGRPWTSLVLWRAAGAPGVAPNCTVTDVTRTRLVCIVRAPPGHALHGDWGLTLNMGPHWVPLRHRARVAPPAVSLAGVACGEGDAAPSAGRRCAGGRRVTLWGAFVGLALPDVAVVFPDAVAATCHPRAVTPQMLQCDLHYAGPAPVLTTVRAAVPAAQLASAAVPLELLPPATPTVHNATGCGPCVPGDILTVCGQDLGLGSAPPDVRLEPEPQALIGTTLPCAVVAHGPERLTCRVGAGVLVGDVRVVVRVAGVAAPQAPAVRVRAVPTVTAVQCAARAAPGPGAQGCMGGQELTLSGANFGHEVAALRILIRVDGGPSPEAPTCRPLYATGAALRCWLTVRSDHDTAGRWALSVAVGDVEGAGYALAFLPLPTPVTADAWGCPAAGCTDGATLTIAGAYFDVKERDSHIVEWERTPESEGSPPMCTPLRVYNFFGDGAAPSPGGGCAHGAFVAEARLECLYNAGRWTTGLWALRVRALGAASGGVAYVRAFTPTPTLTPTPTGSRTDTATGVRRELALVPRWAAPGALHNGVNHTVEVRVVDPGRTRVVLRVEGPGELLHTAESAALCDPGNGTGTEVVCDFGAAVEGAALVLLRPTPGWWLLLPGPAAPAVTLSGTLFSADDVGERAWQTAALATRIVIPDAAVAWREGNSDGSASSDYVAAAAVVDNRGLGFVEGISVSLALPSNLNLSAPTAIVPTFEPPYPRGDARCSVDLSARAAECRIAALPPESRAVLTLERLAVEETESEALLFRAEIASVSPDANAANNVAELEVVRYTGGYLMAPDASHVDAVFTHSLDVRAFPNGTAVPCEFVLDASALPLVGADPNCTIVTPKRLRVAFRTRPRLQPGMRLVLHPDLRPAVCTTAAGCPAFEPYAGYVRARDVRAPALALAGPAAVGPCQPLVLDASQSLVTTIWYTQNWTCHAILGSARGPTPVPEVSRLLRNASEVLVVSPGLLAAGDYTFAVEFVDHFGQRGTAALNVTVAARPTLSLRLGHATDLAVYAWEGVRLSAAATTGACGGPAPQHEYRWQCVSHPRALADAPGRAAAVALPAHALPPGDRYDFLVRATDAAWGLTAAALVRVTVRRSPLKVLLAGSLRPVLRAGDPLRLDASTSYDPDNAVRGPGSLGFSWSACLEGQALPALRPDPASCAPVPLPVPGLPGLGGETGPILFAPGATTALWPRGWICFEVEGRATGRVGRARQWVRVGAATDAPVVPALGVEIVPVARGAPASHGSVVHRAPEPLVLRALVATPRPNVTYQWRMWADDGEAMDLQDAVLCRTLDHQKTLVVDAAQLLMPHVVVTVRAETTDGAAEAWLTVTLLHPPTTGRLTAALSGGEVLLRAVGWMDPEGEALRYRFAYTVPHGTAILNPVPQHGNALRFPAPPLPAPANVLFRVEVFDARNTSRVAVARLGLGPRRNATGNATGDAAAVTAALVGDLMGQAPNFTQGAFYEILLSNAPAALASDGAIQNWLEAARLATAAEPCVVPPEPVLEATASLVRTLPADLPARGVPPVARSTLAVVSAALSSCAYTAPPTGPRYVYPGRDITRAAARRAATAILDALATLILSRTPGLHQRECYAAATATLCTVSGTPKSAARVSLPGDELQVALPPQWPAHATLDGHPLPYHTDVGVGLVRLYNSDLNTTSFMATLFTADARPVTLAALPQAQRITLDLRVPFPVDPTKQLACAYVDADAGAESVMGVYYVGSPSGGGAQPHNHTAVRCQSTHLTEFYMGYHYDFGGTPAPTPEGGLCLLLWVAMGWWGLYAAAALALEVRIVQCRRRVARAAPGDDCPRLGAEARALLRHVLEYHDWLALCCGAALPHRAYQLTLLHCTVLGAMLANLLLLDAALPLALGPLLALGLVLPARGALALVLRLAGLPADAHARRPPTCLPERALPLPPPATVAQNPFVPPRTPSNPLLQVSPPSPSHKVRPVATPGQQPPPDGANFSQEWARFFNNCLSVETREALEQSSVGTPSVASSWDPPSDAPVSCAGDHWDTPASHRGSQWSLSDALGRLSTSDESDTGPVALPSAPGSPTGVELVMPPRSPTVLSTSATWSRSGSPRASLEGLGPGLPRPVVPAPALPANMRHGGSRPVTPPRSRWEPPQVNGLVHAHLLAALEAPADLPDDGTMEDVRRCVAVLCLCPSHCPSPSHGRSPSHCPSPSHGRSPSHCPSPSHGRSPSHYPSPSHGRSPSHCPQYRSHIAVAWRPAN